MMWKSVISLALIGIVKAIELHHAHGYPALIKAPIATHHKLVEIEDGPAEYEFSYSVHDPHTGDIKGQKESRKGDVVDGSYELIDPDGHRRLVQYHADKHSGFNAIVHREPTDIKIPVPEHKIITAAKLVAPIHKVIAEPAVHYAPAAHITKVLAPATHAHGTHVSFAAPEFSYHY